MFETYTTRLRATLAQLAGHQMRSLNYKLADQGLRIAYIDEFEEDVAAAVQREEQLENLRIPQVIRDLGAQVGDFLFRWQYPPVCDKVVWGSAGVVSLYAMYAPFDEQLREEDPQPLNLFGSYNVFDLMSQDHYVATKFERGRPEPVLYYFTAETDTHYRLHLNLEQYLEALLETRGLFPWQELFVDDERFQPSEARIHLLRCQLHELFPDANLRRFA